MSNLLVKAGGGLLVVQRNIEPGFGKWALPGGYIDHGETWQQGAVRELREEAGIVWPDSQVRLIDVKSSSNGNLLIFGATTTEVPVPEFTPNSEVSAIKVLHEPEPLAFPTHSEMARWFFHNQKNHWVV